MSESAVLLPSGTVRCSDADRERTAAKLREATGEGRLTMEELEERLTGVYAARYGDELDLLVTDLPRTPDRTRPGGWTAVLAAAWTQLLADLALLAGRRGSRWNRRRLIIAAVVLLLLAGLTVAAVHGFVGDGFEHHGDFPEGQRGF